MSEKQKKVSRGQRMEELRQKAFSHCGLKEVMEVYGNWRRLEAIRPSHGQGAVPGGSTSVSGATKGRRVG